MNEKIKIMIKKSIMVVIGTVISALGISLFFALNIGSDPISVLVDGEHVLLKLDYGTVETINNCILVVVGLIFARKYLHIGTVIGALSVGPLMNIFVPILNNIISDSVGFFARFMLLFPAVALLGFGIAVVISVNFGVGAMEILALSLRDATKLKLQWVKIGLDVIFTISGYLMGGIVGAGTFVGVLLTGPVIGLTLPPMKLLACRLKIVSTGEDSATVG